MRIAVVFDTPYSGWDHLAHERQMQHEVGAWQSEEPEMEYQIGHAIRELGHEVRLLGVCDDLQYLVSCLRGWNPIWSLTRRKRSGKRNPGVAVPGLLEADEARPQVGAGRSPLAAGGQRQPIHQQWT
jgi:hypothetical protein